MSDHNTFANLIWQIDELVRLYGQFREGPRSKIFSNAASGYTRVTVERPLRLRYRMTLEDKARFLDACPHPLDDVQAIYQTLGREPQLSWPTTWERIETLLKKRGSRWKAPEQKLFRSVFTQRDSNAAALANEADAESPVLRLKRLGRLKGGAGFPDAEQNVAGAALIAAAVTGQVEVGGRW